MERRHEHFVITRNGRPAAVIVPSDEFDAIEETVDVLGDEELFAALRESDRDVKAGRVMSLEKVRRELGLG